MRTIIVMLIIVIASFTVIASEETVYSVDPSPYYDSQPRIHGQYIIWRRAINQNEDPYIQLREPSWIMVHNTETRKTYNITPENTIMATDVYFHAQSPDIHGNKIIYEAQATPNSADARLYMYNISGKDTWEIPIKSTQRAKGHLHAIHGTWICYTHYNDDKRQAYLYNYEAGIYRTIISRSDPYTVYGMVMDSEKVILTLVENGNYSVMVHKITSASNTFVNLEGNNFTRVIATSVNGNEVALSIQKDTTWETYKYNIATEVLIQFLPNTHGLLISAETSAYERDGDIFINNIHIHSSQYKYLSDIHEQEIVWMDNRDSAVNYGDARDNFDIYARTVVTDREILLDDMIIVILIIIAVTCVLAIRRGRKEGIR